MRAQCGSGKRWPGFTIGRAAILACLSLALAGGHAALARQDAKPEPQSAPETKPDAAPKPKRGLTPKEIEAQKQSLAHVHQMIEDWPFLKRFHEEDEALGAPKAGEKRVIFMGDSITQNWLHNGLPEGTPEGTPGWEFFPGKPYVNRGISGQTTPQMLLRFHQDVIDLKPAAVVIFAGTNDVAGNTGEMTPLQTEENLESMADLARAHGIKVVFCSILPAFDFPWKRGRSPAPKIVELNAWIKAYAAKHGHVYVDFYSAMADERGGLPAALSKDGVHPGKAGYDIMNPLVEAGIAEALAK